MSVLWTSKEAEAATGGTAIGTWAVNGISIDTRTLEPGDLFVPLKAARDGHEFIPMALERGAGAVVSERAVDNIPALHVKDSLHALEHLGIAARKRSACRRIAVTGSVGKTSVKSLLAHVFGAFGPTHASQKSYNNHWGVPLTLATLPKSSKYGIFEMGMNHHGELLALSELVKPQVAIVTKIAPAHLEFFKDLEDIAKAKGEIFTPMAKGGVAILPADSPQISVLRQAAAHLKILSFGRAPGADARIFDEAITAGASTCKLEIFGKTVSVELPLSGAHHLENAACVLLAVQACGLPLERALASLGTMEKLDGRGAVSTLKINGAEITLIDEGYNANPASMAAAIAALGCQERRHETRRIAILGDMLELGSDELALHADLYADLVRAGIDRVFTSGARMKTLHEVLPDDMAAGWQNSADALLPLLQAEIQSGDVVMAKGSNASGIANLVQTLKQTYQIGNPAHVI